MSEILVVSGTAVVVDVLAEQSGLAALGVVAACASLPVALGKQDVAAVIWDTPFSADDTAFWKELSAQQRAQIPHIFVLGADKMDGVTECFQKPVRLGRLMDRLHFHVATAPRLEGESLDFGFYRLDAHVRQIVGLRDESVIDLTEKETALLRQLALEDRVWTKQELMERVWGYAPDADSRTLETHIYHLRQKLDQPDFPVIVNETSGYRLNRG